MNNVKLLSGPNAKVGFVRPPLKAEAENLMPATRWTTHAPRVLLLQGPVGPFFAELSHALVSAGADVTQMTFGRHDTMFGGGARERKVRSGLAGFEAELSEVIHQGVDVIVLFGSERPAHRIARSLGEKTNTPVICLEEGYKRPGNVTCEYGGNNAGSPICQWDVSKLQTSSDPQPPGQDYQGFWSMVRFAAALYTWRQLSTDAREREFFHRETPLAAEVFFWGRNILRKHVFGAGQKAKVAKLIKEHRRNYYVVALQVPTDANITRASRGWNTELLIKKTVASFVHSAPKDARLVFKVHPMARGHSADHKMVNQVAKDMGVGDRVLAVFEGAMGQLTRASAGMLTINSSSGLSAIYHGVPLMVFGDSVFAHTQLATVYRSEKDIDRFWTAGHKATARMRQAYLQNVEEQALVPGDFYAKDGRAVAVQNTMLRIFEAGHVLDLAAE